MMNNNAAAATGRRRRRRQPERTLAERISLREKRAFQSKVSLILTAVTLGLLLLLALLTNDRNSAATTYHNDDVGRSAEELQQQQQQQQERQSGWRRRRRQLKKDEDNNGDSSSSSSATNTTTDYSHYSCNSLNEVTPDAGDDQCNFATTCNRNVGVWAPIVYCSPHGRIWLIFLSPVMLLWLVLLFRMLGSTAEDYFSPALEMFSGKLGLPPRFAGVSLLALGNGAADVSATVSAITSDPQIGYKLALGALTGAAMLISGVISAVVILTAQGVPCRGALVRDVCAMLITVVTVWTQLSRGSIGSDSISLFFALYIGFVLLVLAADIYHRAVVIPRQAHQAAVAELARQETAVTEVVAKKSRFDTMLTALSNYDNDMTMTDEHGAAIESDDLAHDRPIQLHGQNGLLSRSHHHHPMHPPHGVGGAGVGLSSPAGGIDDENGHPMASQHAYTVLEDQESISCLVRQGQLSTTWLAALQESRDEVIAHAQTVWDDICYDGDLHAIQKFLLLCELFFTAMRKLTVPIPCEGYYNRGLVALSLALSPIWLFHYMYDNFDFDILRYWYIVLLVIGMVTIGAAALMRCAPSGDDANLSIVVATPIALYGFIIAATWIDTIAEALVSLLNFLGIILRIPGPILGLTVLAWGNSMGDLNANMTMARKGLANMAMTACFAGPVFNILVGLGMGFSSLSAITGQATNEVSVSPSIVTGFVFISINCIALLAVGLTRGRIPKHFGYGALALYIAYVAISIALQYSSKFNGDDS